MNNEKVNVTINSGESFLGADIKKWCKINKKNPIAREILNKYYADDRKFKPSQQAYYFIENISTGDAYKATGTTRSAGVKLIRDKEKSPKVQHGRTMSRTEFISEVNAFVVPVITKNFTLYPLEDINYNCKETLILVKLSHGPIFVYLFRKFIVIDTDDEEICFDTYYDAYKRIAEYVQSDVKQEEK